MVTPETSFVIVEIADEAPIMIEIPESLKRSADFEKIMAEIDSKLEKHDMCVELYLTDEIASKD